MSDPFAAPEGLRDVPVGLWPSPFQQWLDCGHRVEADELMGRYHGDTGCEGCVMEAWEDERNTSRLL